LPLRREGRYSSVDRLLSLLRCDGRMTSLRSAGNGTLMCSLSGRLVYPMQNLGRFASPSQRGRRRDRAAACAWAAFDSQRSATEQRGGTTVAPGI